MSRSPCQVLFYDHPAATWRRCGRPESQVEFGSVCPDHRRELARLEAAGLADRVRFATDDPDPAPAPPGAGEGESTQTALPIPPPAPRPYPWQPTTRAARPAGRTR